MVLAACGQPASSGDGALEGQNLGLSLTQALTASTAVRAPYRCGRLWPTTAPQVKGWEMSLQDKVLIVDRAPQSVPLMLASVADARGAEETTLAGIRQIKKRLLTEGVEVLVSLGGQGQNLVAITSVLRTLSSDSYLLIAIPGDRESVPAHRKAIAELASAGVAVIDGAQYRTIKVGPLLLANLPGTLMTENLVAQDDGCEHTQEDIDQLAQTISSLERDVTIIASYSPSRGTSDRGAGRIHVGERQMNSLSGLLLHGLVEPSTDAAKSGTLSMADSDTTLRSLATGSLDPLSGSVSALVLSISSQKVLWSRLVEAPK